MSTSKPKPFVRTISKDRWQHSAVYAVHGFWSGDNVRVTKRKSLDDLRRWETPEVNWSTGGADIAQEPDRIFAAECFAAALKNAAKLARRWSRSSPAPQNAP